MPRRNRNIPKIDLRKIKPTHVYSLREISKDTNRSIATVRRWIRLGLPTIDGTDLVDGAQLLQWLSNQREARKFPCAPDEFFCFPCRTQRHAKIGSVVIRPRNTILLSIEGECGECGTGFRKGGAMANIEEIEDVWESYTKNVHYIERYRNSPINER